MLEVDKNTFEAEVLQAPGKVVVDFSGAGCVPCAALMPHVHGGSAGAPLCVIAVLALRPRSLEQPLSETSLVSVLKERAPESLSWMIKCSSLEETHITSAHHSLAELAQGPPNHKGAGTCHPN